MYIFFKSRVIALLLCLNCILAAAQVDADPGLDQTIRHGTLKNGLQYFIKPVSEKQKRIYLQLYHKAGNFQEDEDQYNIAHAIEHLAFKSTENFPSGIRYDNRIKSLDMSTSNLSATIGNYFFEAPTGDSDAFELGLMWFHDIINGLKLKEKDINQVRGELNQEILLRIGDKQNDYLAEQRLKSNLLPCLSFNPDYYNHNRTFQPEVLMRHFNDWSRPDLMAISVIGNIANLDSMEFKIKERFQDLPSAQNPRKLRNCGTEYYKRPPQFYIVERPRDTLRLLQNDQVQTWLYYRDPESKMSTGTKEGLKRLVLLESLSAILNNRFQEVTSEYQSFKVISQNLYRSYSLFPAIEIKLDSKNGKERDDLRRIIKTIHQLRTFGISNEEWISIKNNQLDILRRKETENPRLWGDEIRRYYFYDEALPNDKYDYLSNWYFNLSLDDFNKFLMDFLSEPPKDIGLIAPENSKALTYNKDEVRSWIEMGYNQLAEPHDSLWIPSFLMNPEEVSQLEEVEYIDVGIGTSGAREIILKNGVKVALKKVPPFGKNFSKVFIQGFTIKGANHFPDEHYFSVINSPAIVMNSGVNGMNKFELNRYFSRTKSLNQGSFFVSISNEEAGIQADGNLEDLEDLMQMVYLYFTSPNKDEKAFNDWRIQERDIFRSPSMGIISVDFKNALIDIFETDSASSVSGKKTNRGTFRYQGTLQTNLKDAMKGYKDIFGSAKDFTFIIRGDFKEEEIMPLIQKYLGNLPNTSGLGKNSNNRVKESKLPEGPIFMELPSPSFYRMKNMMYGFKYISEAVNTSNWQEQLRVEALGAITNHKAWGLRFDNDYAIYLIGAIGKLNQYTNQFEISSFFHCEPEEFEAIRNEFKEIITEIKMGEISELEFKQSMVRMNRMKSSNVSNHPKLIGTKLYNHYRHSQPWIDPIEIENFVKSLTIKDVINTANKYFKEENLYEFYMKDKGGRGFGN